MLKNLMFVFCCWQVLFGSLQAIADGNGTEKEKVFKRLEELSTAINQYKEDRLSSFWTDDGEFSNPLTGEVVTGKEAITKFLQERTKEIKDRQLKFSFKPEQIDFPDQNTAVVDGLSEIFDKKVLLLRNARQIVLIKENGQWYLDTVREIEVAPPPPLYSHLKGLEWLIGKWVDQDDDVTITFTADWDKFKNFIVQRFKMDVYDIGVMEGIQIIGWDSIENKIRSWVFDSDGGFGSGLWSKNDKGWSVAVNYVLSDGKKASATNEYTLVNDKSYSFASTNRISDGETLENIEPVTVVKENL